MKKRLYQPTWLLALGIFLTAGAHLTYTIEFLAWICSVPFLIYLHRTRGILSRILFVLAMILAWSAAVMKIITDPIPYVMIPMFSVPIAILQAPAYLVWAKFRGRPFSYLIFPAVLVLMEWIQYTLTPLGSWGSAAYTMVDQVVFLQIGSVFGMAGLSFIIYLVNMVIAERIIDPKDHYAKVTVAGSVLVLILVFGSLRVDLYSARSRDQVTVAAVGTDSRIGGLPLPSPEVRESNRDILFERTKKAASSGAKLVVWNEASAALLPGEEEIWKSQLADLSRENRITLIASYIVLLSEEPFRFENKYLSFLPDGTLAYTYHKHEPVPGEPALKGKEPIETVAMDGVHIGGAICYDYDFPYLARSFGRKGADIVGVPSSDWRGIDPIHTKMAALRAIEQGHSVLRSTRFGLSAAINPVGVVESQMSSFNQNERIMIAHLPVSKVKTVYSFIGDILIYACIAFIGVFMAWNLGLIRTRW